ncbi:MAG: HD domain-containing protein, partial [Saccharolobus sp.]
MSSQENATKEDNYLNIVKAAYYLFTPYIGLTAWKRAEPVSALFHSLSVALIARDVAQILTDNKDEIDLAAYGGLVHDFFQKTKGEEGKLPKEIASEIVKTVFSNIGVKKEIIREIIDAGNYNIAENPSIWNGKHPIAGLSMWIGDTVASTSSAFLVEYNVLSRSNKLGNNQQKLLQNLKFDVVSITIPQLALRSAMYRKIYENVKNSKAVPVIARDGLVIIRDSNTKLGFKIDMNDLRPDEDLVNAVLEKRKSKSKKSSSESTDKDKIEKEFLPEKVKKNGEKFSIHESVKNALVNLELENIEYKQDAEYNCMFCGYLVTDPLTPKWYGYTLYGESTLERWSPRVEPLTNLNTTFSKPIKEGLVSCPLCVLDAFTYREIIGAQSQTNLDYIIHFYFPLPTHYWLAEYFAKILEQILYPVYDTSGKAYYDFVDKINKSLDDPKEWYKAANELYVSRGKGSSIPLIDSTWSTIVLPTSSKQKGEFNKDLAFSISAIAVGMFFTGLYPATFSAKVSPAYEKKLLSPVKPIYDFDPTNSKYEADTPLVITTMASLYTIPEGNLDNKISEILRYF